MAESAGNSRRGPTRGAERFEARARWTARPALARLVRLLALVVPLVIAVSVAWLVGMMLSLRDEGVEWFIRWAVMSAVAVAVLVVVERLARRLLPLAALLNLSLVFPDRAPSRFAVALRAGGASQLEARVREESANATDRATADVAATILAYVLALQGHDRRTRGHSERVRAYSVLIGEELGLGHDELDKLQWAALLHDVGKLEVPSSILNKDGRPTDDEWSTIARHPDHGKRLIAPLAPWLGEWVGAVGEHHERWEGGGYPHGLRGEGISLAARIVAVADSFEVMTAPRSYKPALSIAAARTELTRCAAAQFDPLVVRAFLNVSLGRLRRVIGPIAVLFQLPVVRPAAALPAPSPTAVAGTFLAALLLIPALWPTASPSTETVAAVGEPSDEAGSGGRRSGSAGGGQGSSGADGSSPDDSATDGVAGVAGSSATSPSGTGGTGSDGPGAGSSGGGGVTDPTSPPPPPPPPPPPEPVVETGTWYLGTNGAGDTGSASVLPLWRDAPVAGGLANYDVDRDGAPGLLVRRSSLGLGETDPAKRQLWSIPVAGPTIFAGEARVQLWAGVKDFAIDKQAWLTIALQDCSASMTGCTTIASTNALVDQTTGPGWKHVDVSLGEVSPLIAAGRALVLRVQVDGSSGDDCWLAYGTTGFAASLTIDEATNA